MLDWIKRWEHTFDGDGRLALYTTDGGLRLIAATNGQIISAPVTEDVIASLAAATAEAASKPATVVTLAELTKRLGLPDHEQSAVGSWTGEGFGHVWTEAEAAELIEIWNADPAGRPEFDEKD